mgnify:FL=1|jgi:hypothetical protein|tara:strand:- start:823 stop:1572 length:750 start_codon:yes stop_codon:yes gene_type:complete
MINRLARLSLLIFLIPAVLLTTHVSAQATDDNEIIITQAGNTLTLYIDQYGYGNKIGGSDFSASATAMSIVGTSLTFNIDQVGDENVIFGALDADTSSYTLAFTGDRNIWDWNIGVTGVSNDSDYLSSITGDENTMNMDQGGNANAERLNFDLSILGDRNVFTSIIDADDVVWNIDVTGSDNNFTTLQKDGGEQAINIDYTGDYGDIDINQMSGTCPTGITTCNGLITLDVTSDNATIQINQKDNAGDS